MGVLALLVGRATLAGHRPAEVGADREAQVDHAHGGPWCTRAAAACQCGGNPVDSRRSNPARGGSAMAKKPTRWTRPEFLRDAALTAGALGAAPRLPPARPRSARRAQTPP